MTSRRTVLHVTTIGIGLELLLGSQLEEMRDRGWDVVLSSAADSSSQTMVERGFRHVPLIHASRAWDPTKDVRFFMELRQVVRSVKPAIVHTHNPKPGILGRPAAWLSPGTRVVNTCHGLYAQPSDPRLKRWAVYSAERLAAAFSDAELYQNHDDLETMSRLMVPEHKLHYLGNGVDLKRFRPKPEERAAARKSLGIESDDAVVVGCVARLVREKGIPELVEAFSIAKKSNPNLRLVLIGWEDDSRDDAYRLPSEAVCDELGIHALGYRDDVEHLYQGMDMFVLLSHREGFPRSVMEASACGVPVIATEIRGCIEAVFPGENGFLVPLLQPQVAAARVAELAADAELRAHLSRGAVQVAREKFDVQNQVDVTLGVYESLLAGIRPRPTSNPPISR